MEALQATEPQLAAQSAVDSGADQQAGPVALADSTEVVEATVAAVDTGN
jgi:hypothetical protein